MVPNQRKTRAPLDRRSEDPVMKKSLVATLIGGAVAALLLNFVQAVAGSDPAGASERAAAPRCRAELAAVTSRYHLSLDERMLLASGSLGRSVHPQSPNLVGIERDMQVNGC
jgi:hypothetical protein